MIYLFKKIIIIICVLNKILYLNYCFQIKRYLFVVNNKFLLKEEFFNKNFDSSKEEEKKEKKLEPKDNIVEKDEDNNFEGFVTLPNYNKKKK